MIAVEMKFLTGKYHATPWGHQVNEGAVEWPPSPWRILRTLIATWYYKFPEVAETDMQGLIEALSSPPTYKLPQTREGHTRHYMPTVGDTKTKIFDTFITVNPCDPLVICWPNASLNTKQIELLDRLSRSINYFGRAESWVDVHVVDLVDNPCDTLPLDGCEVGEDEELVRILRLADSDSFSCWREATVDALLSQKLREEREKAIAKGKPADKVKLTPKAVAAIESSLPKATFEALQCDTGELRKAGWNRPPGSEWAEYVRPVSKSNAATTRLRTTGSYPTVARYAVAGKVLPRLTDAVLLGERIRSYLMGISGKRNGGECSMIFSGKTQEGKPLSSDIMQHGHAHFLSESYGPNNCGKVTHVVVYAPAGFNEEDQAVLTSLRGVYGSDGHDLQLILLGMGSPADFGGSNTRAGQSPTLDTSDVWVSRTPIVATDHLRIRKSDRRDQVSLEKATVRELERLVRRELARRPWLAGVAESAKIERMDNTELGGTKTSWLKFRRQRSKGGGQCSTTHGYGVRLTLSEPVTGPVSLGYASHFGLGLFESDGRDSVNKHSDHYAPASTP